MNRKNFIKKSSIGLGLTFIPALMQGQTSHSKEGQSVKNDPKIIDDLEGSVLNVIGDVQMHKLNGMETGNQITEWISNLDPGIGIPPHIHTKEDEIFRVIEGQIEIIIDGKPNVLEAGDIAFAPKNIPHAWKVIGKEQAKMITSAFPAGIEHMFAELSDLPPGPPNFEKVAEICAKQGIRFV